MDTVWRNVRDILINRGWVLKILEPNLFFECSECGYILTLELDETPPPECSNCIVDFLDLTGENECAVEFYSVLNEWEFDFYEQDEAFALQEIDMFHFPCDCPKFNPETSTHIYTSCDYIVDEDGIEELPPAPICLVCFGCYRCREYEETDDSYL